MDVMKSQRIYQKRAIGVDKGVMPVVSYCQVLTVCSWLVTNFVYVEYTLGIG